MKNFTKKISTLLLVFNILFILVAPEVSAFTNSENNPAKLSLDASNKPGMPSKFRKSTDELTLPSNSSLNLKGLDTLNISGSKQFSQDGLAYIKQSIGDNIPITVVDLRQESHGFVNGMAISWKNDKNNANAGLTPAEVSSTEEALLKSIPIGEPITFSNKPNLKVVPKIVQDERELTKTFAIDYIRIPVTDRTIPTDEYVDYFISSVREKDPNTWFHFHCKAGIGRTTLFMIMYDMMRNAKNVSRDDIIERQLLLANFSKRKILGYKSKKKFDFLDRFYNYSKENNDNFKTTWTQWNNSQSQTSTKVLSKSIDIQNIADIKKFYLAS